MIDCQDKYIPFKGWVKEYHFKYKFRNMPNLVADKYGNFFILTNCKNKRTTFFKRLNSENGYIYYNRNQVRLSTIRKRAIVNLESFLMN